MKINNSSFFNNAINSSYYGIYNLAAASNVKYYGYLRVFNNGTTDGTNYQAMNYTNITK